MDLDRILTEELDPGAHHYLVPGTVTIKEKKPGVFTRYGAHQEKASSGKTSSKETLQGSS